MDVFQVKDAFSMADELVLRLTSRREELLEAIRYKHQEAPQTPIPVLALHILPFDSYRPGNRIDVAEARKHSNLLQLAGERDGSFSFNFDGARVQNDKDYLQLYHSGITEELITGIFVNGPKGPIVSSRWLSWDTMKSVGARLALLRALGIDGPVFVGISLLGIKDLPLISLQAVEGQLHELKIPDLPDRKDLVTDAILVDSVGSLELEGKMVVGNKEIPKYWDAAATLIKPALDSIWNGYGIERCLEYNETNELVGYVSSSDILKVDPTAWL
jgi:hypothetical protein